jgi:hypothetical protein
MLIGTKPERGLNGESEGCADGCGEGTLSGTSDA